MNCPDLIGQVLDGKYQMTRELGRGGMGAVYLATHLGTERPVAVKVIAPQFMERAEFVERFRREARAAGRLRHPNVVNVTDFGFAASKDGQVAYLVMEYLDGCTLGEILDEEKNLPVGWTLDILDQVCSAVQEAHDQGIIHRDLKPDNVWLEPNQRGGYTVKVLDFGIAKLEEQDAMAAEGNGLVSSTAPTYADPTKTTLGGAEGTVAGTAPTHIGEGETIAHQGHGSTFAAPARATPREASNSESETAIFDGDISEDYQDTVGTKVLSDGDSSLPSTTGRSLYDSQNSGGLTRVGAVLGTPLYMSPEQCRGEHLVKFLMLTGFFSLPIIGLTLALLILSFLKVSEIVSSGASGTAVAFLGFLLSIASAFCTSLITGTIAWIVTQYLSIPLRPVRLRPALKEARRKWKRMAGASLLTAILPFVAACVAAIAGFILFGLIGLLLVLVTDSYEVAAIIGAIGAAVFGFFGFLLAYIAWILVPPIVMMENVGVVEALRRSRRLVKRSFVTAFGAVCIIFLIPFIVAGSISIFVNVAGKAYDSKPEAGDAPVVESSLTAENEKKPGINFSFGKLPAVRLTGKDMDMRERVKATLLESLIQVLWLPMQIFVFSFSGIIVALLYLKTRLAGGESMSDLIERFEDDGRPKKKWQERVRQRLIQSGRIPSKP